MIEGQDREWLNREVLESAQYLVILKENKKVFYFSVSQGLGLVNNTKHTFEMKLLVLVSILERIAIYLGLFLLIWSVFFAKLRPASQRINKKNEVIVS